ncbi:MAG: hypothetical protein ACTTIC_00010 [Helicobacteraceae bacterium]
MDRTKEYIALSRLWLTVFISVFVALASWVINNYVEHTALAILGGFGLIPLAMAVALTHLFIITKTKEL